MVFLNTAEKQGLSKDEYLIFLQLLAPFAPHITEELWVKTGKNESIHMSEWPEADPSLLQDEEITLSVQINGKMRGTVQVSPDADEQTVLKIVKDDERLSSRVPQETVNVIYVPRRIINIISKD